MRGPVTQIEHPALEARAGVLIGEAELTDRGRVALVLQAAGLLSLCEVAGWRTCGFASAVVDSEGRLGGVTVEPGAAAQNALGSLVDLLATLFGGLPIAGRGEARRSARELVARWSGALDRASADRAVTDLLASASFLERPEFEPARLALRGTLVRGSHRVEWHAGRSGPWSSGAADEDLERLVDASRWVDAARLVRRRTELAAEEPILSARALLGAGRAESALLVLEGRHGALEETLRAECCAQLGEIGAAREAIRRLERLDLEADQLVAAGDIALRIFAISREPDAARDWAARAFAAARGTQRVSARLLTALAAVDRDDLASAQRALSNLCDVGEESASDALDLPSTRLRYQVAYLVALGRKESAAAIAAVSALLGSARRQMSFAAAGREWSNLGLARLLAREFAGAERAYTHAARLLRRCDGPLAVTLAGANLADVRLRRGSLRDVETIAQASLAENRRSGNLRGELEDELLLVRRDLVAGELLPAVERARRVGARAVAAGLATLASRVAITEVRALGWLERAGEARLRLAEALSPELSDTEALDELEPEELPFLFLLAGEPDRGLEMAERSGVSALLAAIVRGESPSPARWREIDRLEPYRRARLMVDIELAAPGLVPSDRRAEAAAVLHRLGARRLAAVLERGESVAWRALARYFERPMGERAAIEELLAEIGHGEAELLSRGPDGERRLAGSGGSELASERSAAFGDGELVLRAREIDEPLRALHALFLRELPVPASEAGRVDAPLQGDSLVLRTALERLQRFAVSELPVLILGENGTGKELAAVEIHRASLRHKGPWVPVNCAGLSETLLLSELFGHCRGAFTGADRDRSGVFESGRGGTVFLDEIGDLPLPAQGSLLRVLQEKEIRRLGEALPRKVDARIVAATNRDLEAMVEQGRFRQDLYFRLKVATVVLPPLRERANDIALLAERFLETLRARKPSLRLTPEARRLLAAHDWPGNVRELKHCLEAAAALADDGLIALEHLDLAASPRPVAGSGADDGDYHRQVEAFRRRLIERALAGSEGSLAAAARQLGVTRQYLSQYVRKYGLEVKR